MHPSVIIFFKYSNFRNIISESMQTIAISGIYMQKTTFISPFTEAQTTVNRQFCSKMCQSGSLEILITSLYL